jgi:hypothetical protein
MQYDGILFYLSKNQITCRKGREIESVFVGRKTDKRPEI